MLYSTKVTATGGRHGSIRSDDGLLELQLAMPKSLGGKGGATNPEQLFAGGYSACFENALLRAGREAGRHFADSDVEVVAEIGLSRSEGDIFVLSAALAVTIAGIDKPGGGNARPKGPRDLPLLKCHQGQRRRGDHRVRQVTAPSGAPVCTVRARGRASSAAV
jgi:osmotically inducible protein OsmC